MQRSQKEFLLKVYLKMPNYKNFIIVGTQRTGSTALAGCINLHEEVACGWEWTQHMPANKKIVCMQRALKTQFDCLAEKQRDQMKQIISDKTQFLGFRCLFRSSEKWLLKPNYSPALIADRFRAHMKWFSNHPDVAIIHLIRHDDLAWIASKLLAKHTGFYSYKKYPKDLKITVPVGMAIKSVQSKRYIDQQLASLRSTNCYMQICYEDFKSNNQLISSQVTDFLGANKHHQIDIDRLVIKPQNTQLLQDRITNYDELQGALNSKCPQKRDYAG